MVEMLLDRATVAKEQQDRATATWLAATAARNQEELAVISQLNVVNLAQGALEGVKETLDQKELVNAVISAGYAVARTALHVISNIKNTVATAVLDVATVRASGAPVH